MNPGHFLIGICAITLAAGVGARLVNQHRHRLLTTIARGWKMQFVPDDRFRLAPRLVDRLPVVAASSVLVKDLMYQTEGERRRYLFSVEFGVGALGAQTRQRRVMGFDEPLSASDSEPELRLAPDNLPLTEQYKWVHDASQ